MKREGQVIFFPCYLLDAMAESINQFVIKNKQYDVFIEHIGVLRCTITSEGESNKSNEILAGTMFIEISENLVNSRFSIQFDLMEEDLCNVQVFNKKELPPQIFDNNSANNDYVFNKKVKTRVLSSEYIAELDMAMIGLQHPTQHEDIINTLYTVPLYETKTGLKVTIMPSYISESFPEDVMPPVTIYKDNYFISINIPAQKFRNSCIGCYILDHKDEWEAILDGINGNVREELAKYRENKNKNNNGEC